MYYRRAVVCYAFFCGQNDPAQRILIKKCFLFAVESVFRVKRFTICSRKSVKDVWKSQVIPDRVWKWFRRQSIDFKAMGQVYQCWWRIFREINKTDAVHSSETSANFYWTTYRHIPKGNALNVILLIRNVVTPDVMLWPYLETFESIQDPRLIKVEKYSRSIPFIALTCQTSGQWKGKRIRSLLLCYKVDLASSAFRILISIFHSVFCF
jgi:hypothetical protein